MGIKVGFRASRWVEGHQGGFTGIKTELTVLKMGYMGHQLGHMGLQMDFMVLS